jgi:hypothetical protein
MRLLLGLGVACALLAGLALRAQWVLFNDLLHLRDPTPQWSPKWFEWTGC